MCYNISVHGAPLLKISSGSCLTSSKSKGPRHGLQSPAPSGLWLAPCPHLQLELTIAQATPNMLASLLFPVLTRLLPPLKVALAIPSAWNVFLPNIHLAGSFKHPLGEPSLIIIYKVNLHSHLQPHFLLYFLNTTVTIQQSLLLTYCLSLLKHKLPVGRAAGLCYLLLNPWHPEQVLNKYLLNKSKNCKIFLHIYKHMCTYSYVYIL